MKKYFTPVVFLFFVTCFVLSSCTNNNLQHPVSLRQIKFELFTDQDFSNETGNIIIEPSISAGNVVLWDSAFAPMAIKDIPKIDRMITFEKMVRTNANLKVGFKYTIENVGMSWQYEQMLSTEKTKTVSFNFK
ncbi:MAG: hypothetical protein JSS93_05715 [Bacteroidetes bacterium]|nr:hypothetical protein [Bacteroidota bacterium]